MHAKSVAAIFALTCCSTLEAIAEESQAVAPDNSSAGMMSGLLSWLVSTVAILALIFILAFLLKRSKFIMRRNGDMSVVGQLSLGPKERLVEVEVHGRKMLLGVTASSISFLTHIPDDQDEKSFARELSTELKKEDLGKELDDKKQSD